jgi:hypothetical protein
MRVDRFHDPAPQLAIFIMRTENGTHTGILYRSSGVLFIMDLQWHEMLRCEPCHKPHHFVVPVLEEEEIDGIVGMCRLIHRRHNVEQRYRIPYAFQPGNNTRFNLQTGELMLGDGLGLSCSTFVLAVFESVGVSLVDFNGWPQRSGDNERHEILLKDMRSGIPKHSIPPAAPEHVAKVEASLPCIRVRPEEVAAAGLFDDLPVPHAQLEPAGRWILERLREAAA